uniref:Uncharacterized protein n=1 Tax=Ciona savignyi TaxID=51511 RepID=H2YBQ5_CIOSA
YLNVNIMNPSQSELEEDDTFFECSDQVRQDSDSENKTESQKDCGSKLDIDGSTESLNKQTDAQAHEIDDMSVKKTKVDTQNRGDSLENFDDVEASLPPLNDESSVEPDPETLLTDQEKEDLKQEANILKIEGNNEFKLQKYTEAKDLYTDGLRICPKCFAKERSVLYANRGASFMASGENDKAIEDCSEAVKLNPDYLRARLRRAQLYENTEKLDEALEDYKFALEKDPSLHQARQALIRLPSQINERNEKLKQEMFGKLKDLGNLVLRPFGLSTNNFQVQQNEGGSYNIQFSQNPPES